MRAQAATAATHARSVPTKKNTTVHALVGQGPLGLEAGEVLAGPSAQLP